jgi:hypothetical protein
MYRQFILPTTTSFQTLWDAMVLAGYCDSLGNMLVSSVKNDAIIPDRVQQLTLTPAAANAGDVTITDQTNTTGYILSNMTNRSDRNTICLREYKFKGSDTNQNLIVEIESI